MDISVVIPFYNEEESVRPLCRLTRAALATSRRDFEVLLIDDGSTDRSYERMREIAADDDRFRVLKLQGNYGQTAALYAGFNHAAGDVIVSMDGDLQNDPRDIPALVARLETGFDVVTGWRENRKDALFVRKVPSMAANWLVRKVTGVAIRDNGCGLRAYRADVIKKYSLYSDMHRLLPTIVGLTGARISEMKVRHHPREYGSSKYGLSRVYKFLFDLAALKIIITLFWLPLFGFGLMALLFVFLSMLVLVMGIVHLSLAPEATMIIYAGAAILLFSLGVFLLILGIVCGLIYDAGGSRVESLLKVETY